MVDTEVRTISQSIVLKKKYETQQSSLPDFMGVGLKWKGIRPKQMSRPHDVGRKAILPTDGDNPQGEVAYRKI